MQCSTCPRRVAIIPQVAMLAILGRVVILAILATFPLGESRKTRVPRSVSRSRGNMRGNSRSTSRGRSRSRIWK